MASIDLLPSLGALVGAQLSSDRIIDGKNSLDVFLGKTGTRSSHEILYYEGDGIRQGNWKLVRGAKGKFELYNLEADPAEVKDLAAKYPDKAREFQNRLKTHAESIEANTREAGFVPEAKFLLNKLENTPRLRHYLGLSDVKAIQRNDETKE